jgi:hypothetical protein
MFGDRDMSGNVISFEGSKDSHIEAKKREKFDAMKEAFQAVREQANPKAQGRHKKKNPKSAKPKKKR